MNQKNIKASLIVLVALAFSTNVYTMNTELSVLRERHKKCDNLTSFQKNHDILIDLENVYPKKSKIKTITSKMVYFCKKITRPLICLSIFTIGAAVGNFYLVYPDPVPPCGGHFVPFPPDFNNTICTEAIEKYLQRIYKLYCT